LFVIDRFQGNRFYAAVFLTCRARLPPANSSREIGRAAQKAKLLDRKVQEFRRKQDRREKIPGPKARGVALQKIERRMPKTVPAALISDFPLGLSAQCTTSVASFFTQFTALWTQLGQPAAIASSSSIESSQFAKSTLVGVIVISPVNGTGSSRNRGQDAADMQRFL